MRNLIFVLVLLIAGVVALGFYRGWFIVEKTGDSETGRQGVQFEIDRNKMDPDIEKAKKKAQENIDKVKEKIGGNSQPGQKPDGQ
jgi:hypothetical protein